MQSMHFGSRTRAFGPCPARLAAGMVNSYIGKLRAIFASIGRAGSATDSSGVSNPAAHPVVNQYLISMREEQAQAHVLPRQATPMFFDKFITLCTHLRQHTLSPTVTPTDRYLYSRDLAFFSLDFYSGDRASDLGRVKTREILTLPGEDGFLFHHTFGKTLRGHDTNIFAIKPCSNRITCPVANLKLYVHLADLMGIQLRHGYLFRVTDRDGRISTNPFQGSAVTSRLTEHLTTLNIHAGETMHSFCSGCTITLSLLGVSTEDVARQVGWKGVKTALSYSQTDVVVNTTKVADLLSKGTSTSPSQPVPEATRLGCEFRARNNLQDFLFAFP